MKCPKLNSQQTSEYSVTATDKLYSAAFLELLLLFFLNSFVFTIKTIELLNREELGVLFIYKYLLICSYL